MKVLGKYSFLVMRSNLLGAKNQKSLQNPVILKLLRLFSYSMERIRTHPSFMPLSPLWLPQKWTIVLPWQDSNPPPPSLSHALMYQNLSCEAFLGGRPDMEVTQMVDIEIAVCCRKFINLELLFVKKMRLLGSLGIYTPYGYCLDSIPWTF